MSRVRCRRARLGSPLPSRRRGVSIVPIVGALSALVFLSTVASVARASLSLVERPGVALQSRPPVAGWRWVEEAPAVDGIDLVLMVDTSAGTGTDQQLRTLQQAAIALLRQLDPGDSVELVSFGSEVNRVEPSTRNLLQLEEAILELTPRGATDFYDALHTVLTEVGETNHAAQTALRPLTVVVLSAGEDTSSLTTFEEVLGLARQSEATIFSIAIQPGSRPAFRETGVELQRLSEETGGRAFLQRDIGEAVSQVAQSLSSLRVALRNPELTDAAIETDRQAIELDPDNPLLRAELGDKLYVRGKVDEAIEELRRAVELAPDNPVYRAGLGYAFFMQRQGDDAAGEFGWAVELDPENSDYHALLGNALIMQTKRDEGIEAFRRAIELNPDDPQLHVMIGRVLRNEGQFDEAIDAYRVVVRLRPDDGEAYRNLGEALNDDEQYDEAIEAYLQARELGSTEPIRLAGTNAPRKVKDVPPTYPPAAVAAGAQGTVVLEAVVGVEGAVTDVKVIRSMPGLDDAATAAVRQWQYTPPLLAGVPVPVIMTVTVNFTMQ